MKLFHIPKAVALTIVALASITNYTHASLIGYADTVVEFSNAGGGSLDCPQGQGGVFNSITNVSTSAPICQPLSVVLGDDPDPTAVDYLSLTAGSFITVGFTDDVIFDGAGDDLFISEVGSASELADIYVSSSLSIDPNDFVFLGQANGNTVSSFDLLNIGFTDQVRAVKIVSLNNGGFPVAPGFDLANVQALNFVASQVPAPAPLALMVLGLAALRYTRRK